MDNRYTKATAINNIRDYYMPSPHEALVGKRVDAFERAKAQYISALKAQIDTAENISFVDVFPKAAPKNEAAADPMLGIDHMGLT